VRRIRRIEGKHAPEVDGLVLLRPLERVHEALRVQWPAEPQVPLRRRLSRAKAAEVVAAGRLAVRLQSGAESVAWSGD